MSTLGYAFTEVGPGGGGEGELGAGGVLGVADVDGGGAGGYLDAVARAVAAIRGLAPVEGDFDTIVAVAAAVAALEPGKLVAAIAERWGVDPRPGQAYKVVWAEVRVVELPVVERPESAAKQREQAR